MRRSLSILCCLLAGTVVLPLRAVENYSGCSTWEGIWLSNDHVEVFVATAPHLRLLHLSEPGGSNLLRDLVDDVSGIKTGYLEPGHRPDSFAIGDLPARIVQRSSRSIILETTTEESSQLSLRWRVELADDAPELTMTHELTNHAAAARKIAVWSLAAVPTNGLVQVDHFDELFLLGGQAFGTAANHLSDTQYRMNLDAPIHPYILRTGLLKSKPSFSYRSARGGFRSSVAEASGPWSPPGINLLFYADVSPQNQFAELEHLGPLQDLPPNESLSLTQVIELIDEKAAALPKLQKTEPLKLSYNLKKGVEQTEDGFLQQWLSPLQGVPVALKPLYAERPPAVTGQAIQFTDTPLEIPRLAPLQAAEPDTPRSIEVTFQPGEIKTAEPQMLVEIGGSGNGYNLWLQNEQLHAGVWGKNDSGDVTAQFMEAPLPAGETAAKLKIRPAAQLAELWLNGNKVAETELPPIMPHRDRCGLGGVAGTSRTRTGRVKAGAAPMNGSISAVNILMGDRAE
jgi:hypothetical protein